MRAGRRKTRTLDDVVFGGDRQAGDPAQMTELPYPITASSKYSTALMLDLSLLGVP